MATNKKPRPMQARIIKAHEPTQPLQPIKKAEGQGDNDQVVAVMKEVRGLLLDLKAQQEEDEP